MNCEMARDLLLQVDLAALRGQGHDELARHLRQCARCQERTRRILDQTAALQAALERAVPRTTPGAAWRSGAAQRTARMPWAVALALAASLAVLLLGRPGQDQAHERGVSPATAPGPFMGTDLTGAPLDVQGPPEQTLAVFQTDNPDIVVIWSF